MIKNQSQMSFSSILASQRKLKNVFFSQINKALDWSALDKVIRKHYDKGFSVDGRPSYSGLVLFKMCLLQYWYNLSDYEVEAQCNDSISFSNFIGIVLEDQVPDHSVISRFRSELTSKGAWEVLFNEVNNQLEGHHIIVKSGLIVDASVTNTPLKPKGKKVHPVTEDRQEDTIVPAEAEKSKDKETEVVSVNKQDVKYDTEAAWLKKAGKLHYGYKKHVGTDNEGMVLAIITTAANESDIVHLLDVAEKAQLPAQSPVTADKGYCSQANKDGLAEMKLRSRIMHKASRNKKLTARELKFNTSISKYRYKIERTFGSMKRWAGAGIARYRGLAKTHTQHLLEAMAHNLYRMPGLAVLATTRINLTKG
jgi:IS5 family transposase